MDFENCLQVLKLKQKIEAERGKDYPTENQKLIYAGERAKMAKSVYIIVVR